MRRNRISENAEAVAREVKLQVIKGEKVVMGKIIKKHGYSDGISKQPIRVRNTQSYKQEMQPLLIQLEKERNRIIEAMKNKDLDEVQYEGLGRVFDTINKNIQLLAGRPTEITKFKLSKDEQEKIDNLLE